MRRSSERAARRSPSPDKEALLSRQNLSDRWHHVREKEDLAPQRRQKDAQQRKTQLLQRLVKELKAEWPEALDQQIRGLGQLYLAHLLDSGGERAEDHEPDLEGSAQRGAARLPRAKGKHRVAAREEKGRREELARRQPWCPTSRRRAVDRERQGASRATGPCRPSLSPPERSKGKRAPSTKTGGGCRHGTDVEKLLAATGGIKRLEERESDATREGRRQLGKWPARRQGPKNKCLDQIPEGKPDHLDQLCPVIPAHRRGASPSAKLGNKSRWQRELEFAFEELFDTNRKLKRHLNLQLDLKPGVEQSPGEDQGFREETQAWRRESQKEKAEGDAEIRVVPAGEPVNPAGMEAHLTPSRTSSQKFLSKLENQKYHRMAKGVVKSDSTLWSPQAGTFPDEKDRLSCSPGSGWEPPQLDALVQGSLQLHPQEQADGVGLMASVQKQKMQVEQRTLKQLDLLKQIEHHKVSLEADLQTELKDGRREQRQAHLAHPKPDSPPDPEKEGGYDRSPTSPSAAIVDDDRHSQMIHDIQQQILEQNKLHKQFLQEARKRLLEFQKIC
ncbi:protein DDC8 homolog [Moschus berezovskii]|uniref:protein DDC8 homolog n=1 Tax=Moschus berezovskii TaxID=68408 RepID=UPI002443F782|nr:protein DDC8 homolog [Moschus berezovskii]